MGIQGARVYSNTLKQEIVRRLEAGERVAAIADEAGIDPKLLYDWRALYRRMGDRGAEPPSGSETGMEWTTAVSGPDVVRTVAVDGRRPVRRQAR